MSKARIINLMSQQAIITTIPLVFQGARPHIVSLQVETPLVFQGARPKPVSIAKLKRGQVVPSKSCKFSIYYILLIHMVYNFAAHGQDKLGGSYGRGNLVTS